ncbi:MAG: CDP-alcohol phosphatidyltransferase family protein [Roseiflexaceae bacterium]|nr:CDP-alcohol phosphatidyltransferase family protein [Roseiflexaceae bacterium]
MVDKVLRESKDTLFAALARGPILQIHPTVVTVLAAVVGLGAAVAAWQSAYWLAVGLWLVSRMLDGLDGAIARAAGKQSDLGAYLDIVLDFVVYAAIPLGLTLANGEPAALLALALLLASFYINGASWMYLAALLEKRNAGAAARGEATSVTMPSGLIEGTETIAFYTLFLLFPDALVILFSVMAALTLITAGQRVIWAVRNV